MLIGTKSKPTHVRFIEYTGKYPSLCMGVLVLEINGQRYYFGYDYDLWNDDGEFIGDNWWLLENFIEDVDWNSDLYLSIDISYNV